MSVDPPAVAPPAADDRTVALLRKVRQLGVTSFDVVDASNPERAERLLARAFPEGDPAIIALIGRSVDSLARERAEDGESTSAGDVAAALSASVERSRRRLAPVTIGVLEWTPGTDEDPPSLPQVEPDRRTPPEVPNPLWSLRLRQSDRSTPEPGEKLGLFSGSFSVLEPDLGSRFETSATPSKAFLIVRDPFSGGRLDGSRFASRTALAGPTTPPLDVRRLHEEFDPVLQLGFLTADHRRTLAQAALRFVLHWPWVATAVIPLPEPERLAEVLGFGATPPMLPDELDRIRRLK